MVWSGAGTSSLMMAVQASAILSRGWKVGDERSFVAG